MIFGESLFIIAKPTSIKLFEYSSIDGSPYASTINEPFKEEDQKDEMGILPEDREPLSPISVLETQIMENPLEPPVWDSYDGLDDEF